MLFDIAIYLVSYLLRFFALLLPSWSVPDFFINAMFWLKGLLFTFTALFPVNELFVTLYIILMFELSVAGVTVVRKILNYFRGSGSI